MNKGEDNLIAWIAGRFPKGDLPIGIGDDMAMLPTSAAGVLVTTDMLMDGVDFDSAKHTPEQIGRKALAVSLSDCAAMAVRPRWALVSVALPNAWTMEQAQGLLLGMEPLAREFDVRLVGGDTNSWDKPLVIDVTLLAEPWPGIPPIRRSGARLGDQIYVTGRLGGSLSGHHLDFEPRVYAARRLAESLGDSLHAMMDLSDGLSTDAGRMARAAGCAIELTQVGVEAVVSESARAASSQDGRSHVEHALNDGEDFELLLAVGLDSGKGHGTLLVADASLSITQIGRVTQGEGVWMLSTDGRRSIIEPKGWEHFKNG